MEGEKKLFFPPKVAVKRVLDLFVFGGDGDRSMYYRRTGVWH